MEYEEINCPLCGSFSSSPLFRDMNRREGLNVEGVYSQCKACGMVYLSYRPAWQEICALEVDQHALSSPGNQLEGPTFGIKQWLIDKLILGPHLWPREDAKPQERLLDIGCGGGSKLIRFSQRGWKVFGVDVNHNAIELARKLVPAGNFFCQELSEDLFPADFFDVIRLDNSLEHIPDIHYILKNCFKFLKPRGAIYICVPNAESLSFKMLKRYSINAWIPFHLNMFNKNTIKLLLQNVGFDAIQIKTYSPIDVLAMSLGQLISPLHKRYFMPYKYYIVITLPVTILSQLLGYGEELVAIATKQISN